jgi:hypothetical protein
MDSKKQPRQRLSNKRLLVGDSFPTKIDNLNNDYEFDGKTAHKDSLFDVTKKVKLSSKAKKMIRKDVKINGIYNKLDAQFKANDEAKQRAENKKHKSNSKRYSRR